VIYLRPDEIPARIRSGDVDLGITGEDLCREFGLGSGLPHILLPKLGFGAARLVVAVPKTWIDVRSIHDLAEVAVEYSSLHRKSLRIATKFPNLTRAFFKRHGIRHYHIVESSGATEGAPASGIADAVVDLTSSGATLAQNHLKEVSEGTVLESSACLLVSRKEGVWNSIRWRILEQFVEQIEARRVAEATSILSFAVPLEKAALAGQLISQRLDCSLLSIVNSGCLAKGVQPLTVVTLKCSKEHRRHLLTLARSLEAADIIVSSCDFHYHQPPAALDAFREILKREKGFRKLPKHGVS